MDRQARLPENRESPTIGDMVVGDSFWVVPWAMWVDRERRCWLHPRYTTHAQPGGTVEMRIDKRSDGYYVAIRGVSHQWSPSNQSYHPGDDLGTDFFPVQGWIE